MTITSVITYYTERKDNSSIRVKNRQSLDPVLILRGSSKNRACNKVVIIKQHHLDLVIGSHITGRHSGVMCPGHRTVKYIFMM